MNELGLGKLITTLQQRDAIHIAVAPVVAAESLQGGDRVGLLPDGRATTKVKDAVGIIDPFFQETVRSGERCWLFLFPGTVTSLRHEWIHPAFDGDKTMAEAWLREYAANVRPYDVEGFGKDYAYQRFMEDVRDGTIFYYGRDCHGLDEVDDADELFRNLSIVLGHKVNGDCFTYSCSC